MGLLSKVGGYVGGGGIIGAAHGAIGSSPADMLTGGAVSNAKSVEETNRLNMEESQRNRDFQLGASNTGYQRSVADLKAAGLNPALAYSNGPASTPSGATATASAPRKGDIGANLASNAKMGMGEAAALNNTQSQTELNKVNAEVGEITSQKLSANAKEAEQNIEKIKAETERSRAEAQRAKMAEKVDRMNMPAKKEAARGAKIHNAIDADAAPIDAILDRIKSWLPFTRSNAKTYNNTTTHNDHFYK